MVSKEDVLKEAEQKNVKFIRLQFTDILGIVKNVSIPVEQLKKALTEGIYFDGSSIHGFVRIQESDMRLEPDPNTFTVLPWRNDGDDESMTARIICDVKEADGSKFEGDPRQVLKRATKKANEMGYSFYCGPEPEFFVFEQEDKKPTLKTNDHGGYFDLAPRDLASDLRRDMILTLEDMGFEIEASHHEVAEGQHEIDFKYDTGLKTADNIATFRTVVRTIAELNNLHATFMPKPITGINGSGMHTHISLFKNGENAFYDKNDKYNLSEPAYKFLGGLIKHAPAVTAVTNPTVNSYKRLIPGYEAPIYMAWSQVNRSALIRIPGVEKPTGKRLEYRSPDPSCNPYLALAVMLQAGLDGIKNNITPPDPITENIYELTQEKRKQYGIQTLPENLKQAIKALKQDQTILKALGNHVSEKYIEAKQTEWNQYKPQVTKWEINRYLSKY